MHGRRGCVESDMCVDIEATLGNDEIVVDSVMAFIEEVILGTCVMLGEFFP